MMTQYKLSLSVVAMALAFNISSVHADNALIVDGSLLDLDFLTSLPTSSTASAISADGSVVAGTSATATGFEVFRWTSGGGMVGLGHLPNNIANSEALGISADGLVVVGYDSQTVAPGITEAFRWTSGGGMQGLGFLPNTGFLLSVANSANADGSVVVGGSVGMSGFEAFRWTSAGGMVGLGFLPGVLAGGSEAKGISSDGSVVVGQSSNAFGGSEAFRWTSAGMVGLGHLINDNTKSSEANAVNTDGSVVVGASDAATGFQEAFRWTSSSGMVGLGVLSNAVNAFSQANAVNADGSVIVGNSGVGSSSQAFRWSSDNGMKSVRSWLEDNGVPVADNISLNKANDVNADGSVIVGLGDFGLGDEAFIARISGVITQRDAYNSISANAIGADMLWRTVDTLVNGAHSRPMSRRVQTGKKTIWIAGDWAHDKRVVRDGSIGLAEFGTGYNFGPAQVNLSFGKTWTDHTIKDTHVRSKINADAYYAMLESIVGLSEDPGLYATFGVYGHWSDTDIKRDYLNAGLHNRSTGKPDRDTWGVRARLDWEQALVLDDVEVSPYLDLSYHETRMDSYTEKGGGFPAYFKSRDDTMSELHLGLNGELPISGSSSIKLLANIEGAHRFDDSSSSTSGHYLGLFAFDIEGREFDSSWFKGGLGVEAEIGKGKASIMLNGTTEGEMPNVWLAASYQIEF